MTDKDIIKALSICDFNETGKPCVDCPYRSKDWNGAWETDETDCRYKMTNDALKRLKALSNNDDIIRDCGEENE